MPIPILSTKLSIPPKRPELVARLRLLNQLDEGRARKLTLISAPAGSGKSTLAAFWLHTLNTRKNPVSRTAWLSLDQEDNDPGRFLLHFVAALKKLDPELGQSVQSYLKTPHILDLNQLMTLLINDLNAHLTESAEPENDIQWVLALDDYHVLTNTSILTAMLFFLNHVPTKFHLVIVTRTEPNFPLPRLRVRQEVTEIRAADLRFTHEETQAFLKRTMGLSLAPEDVSLMEDHTEGWIAGLQMAALSLRGQRQSGANPQLQALQADELGNGGGKIIDYLAAEVLRQQPVEISQFLHQTAILDRFTANLCNAVTGRSDGQEILAYLEQANLFLISLDDQHHWYRYHHLFADFLRAEIAQSEQQELHARATCWYENSELMPEAIKHALAGRDYDTAIRLIRRSVEETCRVGAYSTLLGWVNALPEIIVRTNTDLLVHKGWILYLRGEIVTGEAYAELAEANIRQEEPSIHRGMLMAFRAYLAINRDEAEQAVSFARQALALLGETESFYHTTALSYLGQAQRLVGDRRAAVHTLRQTVALGQRLEHHMPAMEAMGYLSLLLYQQGKLRDAIAACQNAASRYLDSRGLPLPVAGLIYVPLGMLFYEVNDLDRVEYYLTTGISLCQQMGTVYATLAGQRTLIKLRAAQGDIEAAWKVLAAARDLAERSENQRRIRTVAAMRAELQIRLGHLSAATLSLASLPANAADRSELENLTIARLLLAQGQLRAAEDLLRQIEAFALQQERYGSLISVYVLQALRAQAMNCPAEALSSLEQAICLAAPDGYLSVFLEEGAPLAAMFSDLRSRAPNFVATLLAAFSRRPGFHPGPSPPAPHAQPLVEQLSETQQSILHLVADGLSNRDIAGRLAITEGTTKWHLNQIYGKLNVCSRTQAVAQARQLGLL